MTHTARLDLRDMPPDAYAALRGVEAYIQRCGLEKSLMELVKMRASQINGCAYCLDMHSKDARRAGETEQRLYLLSGWHESPLYTPRERAALRWTESLTGIADTHAPDADYEALLPHFNTTEIGNLSVLIGMINLWNRLAIGFRAVHPVQA